MLAPAVLVAAPLLAGVAIGAHAGGPAWIPAVVLAVAWVAAALSLHHHCQRWFPFACIAGCAAAGLVLGTSASRAAATPSILDWYATSSGAREPVQVTGRLRQDATTTPFGVVAVADVSSIRTGGGAERIVGGGVRVSIGGAFASSRARAWTQGRTVTFSTTLRDPIGYRNIGVADDRERLMRDRIALLGSVKSGTLVRVAARGARYDELPSALRAYVRSATADAVGRWSVRSAGVVTAILIGDRGGLDQDDERRLQEAGTYHVIAISGGNIALLTAMLVFLGRAGRLPLRATYAASMVVLTFYGYTAGLAPSVLRATLAGVIYLFARLIDHRGSPMNALAVAGAIAAAWAPLSVLDPGFVLSFGATFGILGGASRMMQVRDRKAGEPWLRRLVRSAAWAATCLGCATVCAEIALLPVGAREFGRVSFAGLVLNFAAVPLMSLIQIAGLAAIAVHPVSVVSASIAGWVAHVATLALLDSARLVDVWPWLVIDVPPPSWWVIASWYAAAYAVLAYWGRRHARTFALAALGATGLLIILGPAPTRAGTADPPLQGWTRIAFIDVGQGDATLVVPAGGTPMLVDAGGSPGSSFDLGRRVTVPALWALGQTRLGVLALTHGDPDHIGGAAAVIRALRPRDVWEGVPVPGHPELARVHQIALQRGATWRPVRAGETYADGVARISVLHPPPPDWQRPRVRNDDSIVLEVRIGDVAVILPGDISQATERTLLPAIEPSPLTILKAPHHGSAGSSSPEFIAATRPAVVIFSAGRRNPFGHPSPTAVARYHSAGARIFRTDEDGEVILDTDGRQVVLWTWSGRREELRIPGRSTIHREDHDDTMPR
jgi:competence protein ComEC